jgi:microcystin degradation protein MlrC
MDLHGNVSWRLAENTDLITCYRMAPHEDAMQTRERAVKIFWTDRKRQGKAGLQSMDCGSYFIAR